MPTALALSPHLDDAVFSAGATLATLARRGWRVTVVTAFTRSVPDPTGFALACQLDKGLGPDVDYMALRRSEDEDACAALGLGAPLWLDFAEAPHRGYRSAAELFAGLRPDDDVEAGLADALSPLISGVDLLLAPQAVGGHVDHLKLVAAIDRVAGRPPATWWTDFPYASRPGVPQRPLESRFAELADMSREASRDAEAVKLAACRCYRSQIAFQFPAGDLDAALERASPERFRIEPGAVPLNA